MDYFTALYYLLPERESPYLQVVRRPYTLPPPPLSTQRRILQDLDSFLAASLLSIDFFRLIHTSTVYVKKEKSVNRIVEGRGEGLSFIE